MLTRDALEELIDELASRPASKRDQVKGIKYDRADVILGGALVLATALDEGGFDAIEVTEAGLREGAFFERLLGEDGLFDDVRSESVHNLAHRFGHDDEHAAHVWELSAAMYDGLAAAGLHDVRRRGARAPVGRLHPPRHRRGRGLRRPPPPLVLPDPERRPARLHARASWS